MYSSLNEIQDDALTLGQTNGLVRRSVLYAAKELPSLVVVSVTLGRHSRRSRFNLDSGHSLAFQSVRVPSQPRSFKGLRRPSETAVRAPATLGSCRACLV